MDLGTNFPDHFFLSKTVLPLTFHTGNQSSAPSGMLTGNPLLNKAYKNFCNLKACSVRQNHIPCSLFKDACLKNSLQLATHLFIVNIDSEQQKKN